VSAQMHAVGAQARAMSVREFIRSSVFSFLFPVPQFTDDRHDFTGEHFEFAWGEVFLT